MTVVERALHRLSAVGRAFVVDPGDERFPLSVEVEALGVRELAGMLVRP